MSIIAQMSEEIARLKARIRELEKSERVLDALYAGGVDNWEWYDDSLEEIRKEDE